MSDPVTGKLELLKKIRPWSGDDVFYPLREFLSSLYEQAAAFGVNIHGVKEVLPVLLKGDARDAYKSLDGATKANLNATLDSLKASLETELLCAKALHVLNELVQEDEEDIKEFGKKVESLSVLAFRDIEGKALTRLQCVSFCEGLQSDHLRQQIIKLQTYPVNFHELIKESAILEKELIETDQAEEVVSRVNYIQLGATPKKVHF